MKTDRSYLLDERALARVLHGPKRLQHMDEETFTVSKVGGTPVTLRIDDQPLGVQYYLRRRVNGSLRIDLHKLTALLDVPEWTRKVVKRTGPNQTAVHEAAAYGVPSADTGGDG